MKYFINRKEKIFFLKFFITKQKNYIIKDFII